MFLTWPVKIECLEVNRSPSDKLFVFLLGDAHHSLSGACPSELRALEVHDFVEHLATVFPNEIIDLYIESYYYPSQKIFSPKRLRSRHQEIMDSVGCPSSLVRSLLSEGFLAQTN